jgi:hypothetical protein
MGCGSTTGKWLYRPPFYGSTPLAAALGQPADRFYREETVPAGRWFVLGRTYDSFVDLYIGRVGDNYWQGDCQIFEQDVRLQIADGSTLQSAVLEQAVWDDHIQIVLDDTLVWQGPDNDFPPETAGTCELNTSWNRSLAVDLTRHFQTPPELRFLIRVSVTGGGEGYAPIRLRYDPARIPVVEQWYPPSLIDALRAVQDGFCQGGARPLDAPPGACVMRNDWPLCEAQLAPPPVAGLPVLATRFQWMCSAGSISAQWTAGTTRRASSTARK